MKTNKSLFRAGHTVTHPSFEGQQLPAQAVILEVHASQLAELSNGLRLPLQEMRRVETGEQWVPIAGYDRYLLSSQGKVVSLFYHQANRQRLLKVLGPSRYPKVTLTNETGSRQKGISRLVAQAFLPPPAEERLQHVMPKDGNPLNVQVGNLQWVDPYETQDEVVVHYLRRRGERHANSKLTTQEVVQIRELVAQGATRQAVADKFEVSRPTVSQIVSGLIRRYA
jgi:predicted XRE-type DNA-binding protein